MRKRSGRRGSSSSSWEKEKRGKEKKRGVFILRA
jgi:hypothetical protein